MASKTLIGGTAYEIKGGKTLVGGTAYEIKGGKTLVGGTAYDVGFEKYVTVYDFGSFRESEEGYEEYHFEAGFPDGYDKCTTLIFDGVEYELQKESHLVEGVDNPTYRLLDSSVDCAFRQITFACQTLGFSTLYWVKICTTPCKDNDDAQSHTAQIGYFE